MAVQRHVATRSTADDEFSQVLQCRAPEERVAGEHIDGLNDVADAAGRISCVMRDQ